MLLSIAAKKLAKQNVLVKDLQGVETLGSITLLATDKTGTLTQNKMTVVGAWLNLNLYDVQEYGGGVLLDKTVPNFNDFLDVLSLCTKYFFIAYPRARFNTADLEKPLDERRVIGDATETGLYQYAAKHVDGIIFVFD